MVHMKQNLIAALNACQAIYGKKYVLEIVRQWIQEIDVGVIIEEVEEMDINLSDIKGGK